MLIHDQATPLSRRRTPEGFLQMRARIGRAGIQDYRAGEIGGPAGAASDSPVRVYRPPVEVFNPASLASFAGKPVTLDHPPAMVDSGNWKQVAVGHSGSSVERDGQHFATDLVVTDAAAVARAEAGSELSNGYWADFDFTPGLTPEGEPYDAVQRNIRGNHIALVDQGRCGPTCTVGAIGAGAAAASADAAMADTATGATSGVAAVAVIDCPPGDAIAVVARLQADIAARDRELAARDGEIAALRARAATDAASLDRRAAERGAVIDAARTILGVGFDPSGLDLGDIRRAALVKALGADAVRGRGDDYVAAAFDTVATLRGTAGAPALNPLAGQLSNVTAAGGTAAGGSTPASALQARNTYLAGAWKPDLSQGDR